MTRVATLVLTFLVLAVGAGLLVGLVLGAAVKGIGSAL